MSEKTQQGLPMSTVERIIVYAQHLLILNQHPAEAKADKAFQERVEFILDQIKRQPKLGILVQHVVRTLATAESNSHLPRPDSSTMAINAQINRRTRAERALMSLMGTANIANSEE